MIKTRVTENLGIKHPIMLAPMGQITLPKLVAAVSNAGGLGMISAAFISPKILKERIKETRELTDKPFGVNFVLNFTNPKQMIKIIEKEELKIVFTSAGSPRAVREGINFKDKGITHLHLVPTVKMAKKAEDMGVDMIVAQGGEAGGIVLPNPVSTMALIPQIVDEIDLPVIAAGGIADARGLFATLALGGDAVMMGTRFLCANECPIPELYKKKVLESKDDSTKILDIGRISVRALRNDDLFDKEDKIDQGTYAKFTGNSLKGENPELSLFTMGESSGLVNEIKSAEEIINSMVEESIKISKDITKFFI
ncbi:MAG: nitronate monooxygenase [archaeon]|nr:nitronate monooxygenase [archaeon]